MQSNPVSRRWLIGLVLLFGLCSVVLATHVALRAAPLPRPFMDPPWNSSVRVSDSVSGAPASRTDAAVASSQSTDDVYAVWIDRRNGDDDVYAAASAHAGQTWGAAVRVNHDVNGAAQSSPDIAENGSGVLHAVWVDSRDGTGQDVWYSSSADGGLTWSQEIQMADVLTTTQTHPAVAARGNTVCVAWSENRTSSSLADIYARCSTDGGSTWEKDAQINDDPPGTANHTWPDITIDPSGRQHVVWRDERAVVHIYHAYFDSGSWSANHNVSVDTPQPNYPSIAANGTRVYVAWQTTSGSNTYVYASASTDGGKTWPASAKLVSDGVNASAPSLTASDYWGAWAGWQSFVETQTILYADHAINNWGTDIVITASTAAKNLPALAAGSSNRVYAVWPQASTDILFSVWNSSTWSSAQPVSDLGEARQERPAASVSSAGTIYAAWMDYRGDATLANVYFARSTDGAQTWSANSRVNNTAYRTTTGPAIAASGPLTVHVAWRNDDLTGWTVYYNRSANGGLAWGTGLQVMAVKGVAGAGYLDLAADTVGNVYIVGNGASGIYLAHSPNGGSRWDTPTQILTATIGRPTLAVDAAGTLHLAWDQYTSVPVFRSDICYARSTDHGQTWINQQCVSTGAIRKTQAHPDLTIDPASGYVYLAWDDNRTGVAGVYFSASSNGGVPWQSPRRISGSSGPSVEPAITSPANGVVYVAWQDGRAGNDDVYYARSTDSGTTWSPPSRVNDDVTTWPQRHPALASGNGVYPLRQDFRRANWDIDASSLMTSCLVPLSSVSISGASTITPGMMLLLTAQIDPANASTPISYNWQPEPDAGQSTALAGYVWGQFGHYTVSVVASNCGGPVSAEHAVTVLDMELPGVWGISPSGWVNTWTPDVSALAQDTGVGLDVSTAQYDYSTDGGASWHGWQPAAVTGVDGTTDPQTITAAAVPFNQDSGLAHLNHIRFRISDMSGNVGTNHDAWVLIDATPPTNPTFVVGDRPTGTWNINPTVVMTFTGAADGSSGVAGYSYLWSQNPTDVPPLALMATQTTARTFIPGWGQDWYFHVRALDHAGNWAASAAHQGPYWIMNVPPSFLTLDPESGGPGAEVWLEGFAFDGQINVTIGFTSTNGSVQWLGDVLTSYDGTFLAVATVPADATQGEHAFIATGGGKTARARFSVTPGLGITIFNSPVHPTEYLQVRVAGLNRGGALLLQSDLLGQTGPIPLGGWTITRTTFLIPTNATSGTHVLTVTNLVNGYIVQAGTAPYQVIVPPPPVPLTATAATIHITSPANQHAVRGDTVYFEGVDPLVCLDNQGKISEYDSTGTCSDTRFNGQVNFTAQLDAGPVDQYLEKCSVTQGTVQDYYGFPIDTQNGHYSGSFTLSNYPDSPYVGSQAWGEHDLCLYAESQVRGDLIGMAAASAPAQDTRSDRLSPQSPSSQQVGGDWVTHRCRVVTCTRFTIDQPPRYNATYQLVDERNWSPIDMSLGPRMMWHGTATGFVNGTAPMQVATTYMQVNQPMVVNQYEGDYLFDVIACHYVPTTSIPAVNGGRGGNYGLQTIPMKWIEETGPAPTGVTTDFKTYLDKKGQLGPFLSFKDAAPGQRPSSPVTIPFKILFDPNTEVVKSVTVFKPDGQSVLATEVVPNTEFSVTLQIDDLEPGLQEVKVVANGHYKLQACPPGDTDGPAWNLPILMAPAPAWLKKPVSNPAAVWTAAEGKYHMAGTVGDGTPQDWSSDQGIDLAFLGHIGNQMSARVHVEEDFDVKTGSWTATVHQISGVANVMCMSVDPNCAHPFDLLLTATPDHGIVESASAPSFPAHYDMVDCTSKPDCQPRFHPLVAHQYGPWTVYNGVIASYWGIVNVNLSINFGIQTSATLDGGFAPDLTPNFTIAPTAAFNGTISLWVDILLGVASAGVDGSATLSFSWPTSVDANGLHDPGIHTCLSLSGRVWVEMLLFDAELGPFDIWSTCWGVLNEMAADSPSGRLPFPLTASTPPPSMMPAPSMAQDGFGHVLGTWVHNGSNDPAQNQGVLYYAYWDGASWSDGAPAVTSTTFLLSEPEVTFAGPGTALAVFASNDVSTTQPMTWTQVKAQTANQQIAYSVWNGQTWSPKTNLTNSSNGPSGRVSLAGDPLHGQAMAVWVHDVSNGGLRMWQIEYSVYRVATGQWSPPQVVAAREPRSIDAEPNVAFDSTGKAVATWVRQHGVSLADNLTSPFNNNDQRELWVATWDPNTNLWTASAPTALPKGALMPSAAFDSQNRLLLAYAINDKDRGGDPTGLGNNNKLGVAISQTNWITKTVGDVLGVERPRIIPLGNDLAAVVFRGFGKVNTPEFSGVPMAVTVDLNKPDVQVSKAAYLTNGGAGWMFAAVAAESGYQSQNQSLVTMGVYNLSDQSVSAAMSGATLRAVSDSPGDRVMALNIPVQPDLSIAVQDFYISETLPLSGTLVPFTVTVRNLGLAPTTQPVMVRIIQDEGTSGELLVATGDVPIDLEFSGSFDLAGTWHAISGVHTLVARVYPDVSKDLDGTNNAATYVVGAPPSPATLVASRALQPLSIGLTWLPVAGPAVAGYRIYRAEISGTLTSVGWSNSPFYVDQNFRRGKQYQYAVSTVTSDGIESMPGTPIIVTAPSQVYLPIVVKH